FDSEYVQQWTAFLSDERLRKVAAHNNLRIGFLPHPNIQPALAQMALPPDVEALTFAGQDVQQLIADAALMVTDYSSMAFNAAYLDRPVVYFQFDAERMGEGAHVGRQGYFDYTDDGFGPVTDTVHRTVDELVAILTTGDRRPAVEYQRRIDATFTQRDGRCCERTTAAIEDLTPYALPDGLVVRAVRRLMRPWRAGRS
ncbi:MAG: CDP-glycerol glycerophosphotransferase family protein, partial [Jatrophihabitantaceae bacterium]